MRVQRTATAILALFLSFMPVASSGAVQYSEEFGAGICPVMLRHYYYHNGTNDYVATLTAARTGEYSGSLTLFGETNAYEVTFERLHIGQRAPLTVRMPAHIRIDYASMDTAGLSGAPATSCPTYVVVRGAADQEGALFAGSAARPAQLRGKIPDLPCGKIWLEQTMEKRPELRMYAPVIKPTTAELHFFVDSDGHVFDPQIVRTSGDSGIDAAAVTSALTARFKPAQFLCAPVISEAHYTFTLEGKDRL